MDKDKLKGMLKISERDKKLLIVVMAVLIMALAYFFGYSNLSSQVDTLSTKKANLEVTKKDLKEKNNNKQKYITDTDKLSKAYAILMDKYDSGSSQPNTIVKSLALSPKTSIYKFGQIASSNTNGTSTYSSNYVGYKTSINITYEGNYEQWKHFIKYINTYASKCTIDSLAASYGESTGTVSGTAVISLYSIEGGDRKFSEPKFDSKTGTKNIFSSGSLTTD